MEKYLLLHQTYKTQKYLFTIINVNHQNYLKPYWFNNYSKNLLSLFFVYIIILKMEGSSEEGDTLNGTVIIKPANHNQSKQSSNSCTMKLAIILLIMCVIFFTVNKIIREQTFKKCQQKLQKAKIQSTKVLKKIDLTKHQQKKEAANKQGSISEAIAPTPINSNGNIQPIIKQKAITLQPQYQIYQKSLNLWLMSTEQKQSLFSKVQHNKDVQELDYSPFLRSKDEQVKHFFKKYENRSEVINWSQWNISIQQEENISKMIDAALIERANKLEELIGAYTRKYKGKSGYMPDQNHGITYDQFLQTLQLKKITGSSIFSISPNQQIKKIEEYQTAYYENKYNISKYKQLPMCIIMPTYNNIQESRYIWSIESLLQQQYSNYRTIIIDDNSKDNTVNATGLYLKWRGVDPSRFILIEGKKRRTALENIYYGVHKYCDYGQIFMIFDGDDELFGRQGFKVINSLYQKHKYYLIYSEFISYNPFNKRNVLQIGLSEDFPYFVKERNSYRTFKHSYSQLRTVISDLILLVPMANLKLKNGNFFGLLYDNALFYPAFEMSCRNFLYLPEIFYWYNINTGSNDWKMAKTQYYRQNRFGIQLQKPFKCIDEILKETKLRK